MEIFRYALGLVIVFIMPVVVTFWLVIHAFSNQWRQSAPQRAYLVAGFAIVLVLTLSVFARAQLMGTNLGMNWILFTLGLAIYLLSWGLWRPVKRHLDFKTFAGVPEVKGEKIELIRDGPFAIVRHPRYLMVIIGVIGWSMMAHYSGVYLVGIASIVGLVAIMQLEERDLVARFGDEYRAYQREVPQLVPTLRGVKRFLGEIR